MMTSGSSLNFLTIEPHIVASRTLADWFEEETGVRVQIHPVPYVDITQRAVLGVTSGAAGYDVVQFWYPMLGSLVEKGVLADITGWWDKHAEQLQAGDLIPVFRDTFCLVNGLRYGIPYDGDTHLLFYNSALFQKHGVQPPETWDDYLEVARAITEAEVGTDVYGCGIMAIKVPIILIGTYLNRLACFGGSFFDEQGMPAINCPPAVAALEHLVVELPYAVPHPTTVGFDEMLGPWLGGQVAMAEFWADLGKMTDNPDQSQIPHQWGVIPLPKGPGAEGRVAAPLNAGWSLGVSASGRDRDLALEFLGFSLRPDISLRICTVAGGLDPVRWSTYDAHEYREYATSALADAAKAAVLSAAVPWPTHSRWPELQAVLNENLFLALTHAKTPQQALDDTQHAWQATLDAAAISASGRGP
jgi:multiple sugar transport system substrate-binding protein